MSTDRRNAGQTYKGWKLTFSNTRPITGQWRAERHGVGLCHSSKEALMRQVDIKLTETRGFA